VEARRFATPAPPRYPVVLPEESVPLDRSCPSRAISSRRDSRPVGADILGSVAGVERASRTLHAGRKRPRGIVVKSPLAATNRDNVTSLLDYDGEVGMSILDKVVAAITPPESEQARLEARVKAQGAAERGSWLEMALDHHDLLRAGFTDTRAAGDASARTAALRNLAVLLLGHAQAEESVLYPALAAADEKAHAEIGYNEQAMVKMQMALLEKLPPMSQEFSDKLEHIEGAVLHHMYEEEGTWFLELQQKAESQVTLTRRFREEFERYVG
jgi:hypothetical protein